MAVEVRVKNLLPDSMGQPGDIKAVYYRRKYYLAIRYQEGWRYTELKRREDVSDVELQENTTYRILDTRNIEVFTIDDDRNLYLKGKAYVEGDKLVLTETDIVKIKEPFYMGEDRFPAKAACIRNEELNYELDTTVGTPITVTAIDTGSSTITLSWLPYIPDIWFGDRTSWALMNLDVITPDDPSRYGDYTAVLKITGGDYASKTLSYEVAQGTITSWSVGHKVMLYNPFRLWEWIPENPIIEAGSASWRSKYVSSGGIFKRDDGKWVMLVTGTDDYNVKSVGAFISADLVHWSPMNYDNPVLVPSGGGSGDWRATYIGLASSIIKLDTEDRYIAYCSGYNATDGKWRLGWAKFDANFSPESIEYSSDEITDSSGSPSGHIAATVVYYGGKYRMIYTDRSDNANPNLATGGWKLVDAESKAAEGPFNFLSTIRVGNLTNDGLYYSSHIDASLLFLYKNRLYLLIGGTSWYKYSGNRGNRVFGLMYLDERHGFPNWVNDPRGPILINPLYGDVIWGSEYYWANDHMGGYPGIASNPDDGKIYLYFSAGYGTDTYRIGCVRVSTDAFY